MNQILSFFQTSFFDKVGNRNILNREYDIVLAGSDKSMDQQWLREEQLGQPGTRDGGSFCLGSPTSTLLSSRDALFLWAVKQSARSGQRGQGAKSLGDSLRCSLPHETALLLAQATIILRLSCLLSVSSPKNISFRSLGTLFYLPLFLLYLIRWLACCRCPFHIFRMNSRVKLFRFDGLKEFISVSLRVLCA